ncbi:MAG: TolC family protein, partial [Cyclobacteriaceae bacterium]|nr:TolC family protein [Cyclobacteriaceae bacterium]
KIYDSLKFHNTMDTRSSLKFFLMVGLYLILQHPISLKGQNVISLESLLSHSKEHTPVQGSFALIDKNQTEIDKVYHSTKYPQLNLIAQGTYQSDVITFPDNPALAFPEIPRAQYRTYLEASHVLFNGGRSKNIYAIESTNNTITKLESENALSEIENVVEGLYFNGLLVQKRKELLVLTIQNLEEQQKIIESRVKNGVLLPSASDAVAIKILELEQQLNEAEYSRQKILFMLSDISGQPLNPSVLLVLPEAPDLMSEEISRYDLMVLDKKIEILENKKSLNQANKKPLVSAFAQGGLGNPNPFNFMEVESSFYYYAGIRLQWNIFNYGRVQANHSMAVSNQEMVKIQQQVTRDKIGREIQSREIEIKQQEALQELDDELVNRQNKMVRTRLSLLENGVGSVEDYLIALVELNGLQIKKELRLIKITQLKYEINRIKGNTN